MTPGVVTPGGGAQLAEVGAALLKLSQEVELCTDVEIRMTQAPGGSKPMPSRVCVQDINFAGISPVKPLTRRHINLHDDSSTEI